MTDAPAFTRGPWSWHQCFDPTGKRITSLDIVPHGGHSLRGVAVLGSVFSCNEADAHLIAAAPEMYEALERWSEWSKHLSLPQGAVEQTHAALAKARGEALPSRIKTNG